MERPTPPTQRARDEWIALRCQSGEPDAFAELVRTFERPLLYYATKLLRDEHAALDVLQNVWLKAFRGVRRLEHPGALRAWLYRLTHGLAVDRLRRERAIERVEQARADQAPEAVIDEDASSDAIDADASIIHRLLDRLPVFHREVLVLHFLEDLPLADVAAVVGCPVGTVKSRIHHAKRALREVLQREGHGIQRP